jgi:hypothetical protein
LLADMEQQIAKHREVLSHCRILETRSNDERWAWRNDGYNSALSCAIDKLTTLYHEIIMGQRVLGLRQPPLDMGDRPWRNDEGDVSFPRAEHPELITACKQARDFLGRISSRVDVGPVFQLLENAIRNAEGGVA